MNASAEVGFLDSEATRERARRLAAAYDALYQSANDKQKQVIRPYKLAWDRYFKKLQEDWWAATFEMGELAGYEEEFARLRRELESSGADVSAVPVIQSAQMLQPLAAAAKDIARDVTAATTKVSRDLSTAAKYIDNASTMLAIAAGVLGGVVALRYLTGVLKP